MTDVLDKIEAEAQAEVDRTAAFTPDAGSVTSRMCAKRVLLLVKVVRKYRERMTVLGGPRPYAEAEALLSGDENGGKP